MATTPRLTMEARKELERRIADLENAMKTIGRVVVDPNGGTLLQRRERVLGILTMYGCQPPEAPVEDAKGAS